MTIEEIRDRLMLYNLKAVAREIDVKYETLWRIATGATKNPSSDVYIKIVNFLESK